MTIASIAAYNYVKITKMRENARKEVESTPKGAEDGGINVEAAAPMLGPNGIVRADRSIERASMAASNKSSRENE